MNLATMAISIRASAHRLRERARHARPGYRLDSIAATLAGATVEHLRADAEHETGEDDLTHLEEILRLHDLDRDPGAGSRVRFEGRCRDNGTMRAMHHHVFNSRSVFEACRAADLDVLALAPRRPFHIVCLCAVGDHNSNTALDERRLGNVLRSSTFPEDRQDARRSDHSASSIVSSPS